MENLKKNSGNDGLTLEYLKSRLAKLEAEWKKGQGLLQNFQSQTQQTQMEMHRVEGAMALLREEMELVGSTASS